MSLRRTCVAAAFVLMTLSAAPARADVLFIPFFGVNFGGDAGKDFSESFDSSQFSWGASIAAMGAGVFGVEGDFKIKLKLFTVPGQVLHRSTRRVVLAGADAVAFIADSQRSASSANAYSYKDLEANLRANGLDINQIPSVVQFNKRDLEDIKPLEEVRKAWEGTGIPTIPAAAAKGEGVIETFEALLVRVGDAEPAECYLVPIDACYEFVGRLRMLWRGFDGGQDVRRFVDEFFTQIAARCKVAAP